MWAGIIFIKPFFRLLFGRQADLNSVVGNTVSAFSVLYGLLIGLISVGVYQTYSDLSDNIAKEASIVAALYRDFSAYDSPAREELQDALKTYVSTTIKVDWPAQQRGIVPPAGSSKVGTLFTKLAHYEPQRLSQQILHAEVLREFNNFIEVRRTRLANVTSGLPGVLWYVVRSTSCCSGCSTCASWSTSCLAACLRSSWARDDLHHRRPGRAVPRRSQRRRRPPRERLRHLDEL
jgi:hypothetical protein